MLADDGSSKRQAPIDQSPRHRHTFPQRGFLHWRLSDDGPGASRIVPGGRHPKPFTQADIADALLNHFICDAQRGRYRYPQRLRGLAEISAGICSKRAPPK